jgi:methionyl-tRNA formyltransferase
MAYGHILRQSFFDLPRLGTYNLHASLLPKYRGASPIQAALAAGDPETGMTLMRMVRRLDAGPMVDKETFPVERLETGATAEEKLAEACVPLLRRNIESLITGKVSAEEQDEGRASYCRKLEKGDGALDFSASARVLAHRINALFPWPGCFFEIAGERIRVGLADFSEESTEAEPGTVLATEKEGLALATGDGVLHILRLQRPGGRLLDAGDFLRGFNLMPGSVVPSAPMSSLV